jgi:hypothetical protein
MFTHMEPDTVAATAQETDAEVMGAVEQGDVERFVVADVSRDDAYLTTPLSEAASLPAWR